MAETTKQDAGAAGPGVAQLRRSPAQGLAQDMTAGSTAQVALREVPFAVMTALRAEPGSAAARRVEEALGCPLPTAAGEVTSAGERHVLWIAPDEFLTWSPDGTLDPVAAGEELADRVGTDRGQAVDVSSNRTTLELSGPWAASVLAKSCTMDLHTSAWPAGRAFATTVGRVPAVVWRVEEDTFRVLPRSSFAEHLVRWLLDGMQEFSDPAARPLWR
ncbi:sarcosine oxidase subunit gamma [Ornithinimicrobium avium]|uniref:Sarcosine oxidase subunit gamma family protein n=1 Tax=Ornithinimicrobium avium TaxID=2283195 RepID=A0A345NK49_9MICO|nr:sarcosine oxidase subunit gamma family protein [Ornithinimicrobium avium]AXH95407.1 sarcosine oxidase subunit gamma family protein [Ornithinimicrobium avium]